VAKTLGKEVGEKALLEATERMVKAGALEAGGTIGREALGEYLLQSRRALAEATPVLEETLGKAANKVNRSLSGYFGAGGADAVREMGLEDTLKGIQSKLKQDVPMAAQAWNGVDEETKIQELLGRMFGAPGATFEAKEVDAIRKLDYTQRATIETLVDTFGSKISFEGYVKAGQAFGSTTAKGELKGVRKIGNFLKKSYGTEIEAAKAIEDAKAPIAEAQKLIAIADKGSLWFKVGVPFTDKTLDLVELTPVKQFTGRVLQRAYNASPIIQSVVDWAGESFVTKYLRQYTKLAGPAVRSELEEAASLAYNYGRAQKSTLGIAAKETIGGLDTADIARTIGDDVFEKAMAAVDPTILHDLQIKTTDDIAARLALGPDIAANKKIMQAVPYFLERGIEDGGDEALGIASHAADKWEKVAATLTMQELEQVQEVATKATLLHEIEKQIDLKILAGTLDDPKAIEKILEDRYKALGNEYVHHMYMPAEDAKRRTIELMTSEQRVRVRTANTHGAMNNRKIASLAQAEALGLKPVNDFAVLTAARLSYSRRAMLANQLIDDLKSLGEIVATGRPKSSEFVELTKAFEGMDARLMGPIVARLQGYYAHPEVVRHLQQLDHLMFNDAAMNKALSWAHQVTNYIKGAQTFSLSFTMRNVMGEGFMAFVGGVKPATVGEAFKALRGVEQEVIVGGRKFLVKDELTEFGKLGGWFAGRSRGNFVQGAQEIIQKEIKIATKKSLGNPFLNINDFNDRLWRFAHYLEERGKGMGVRDAVAAVRRYHVDYDDLTKMERSLGRFIIPFYTYMRKNLPNALRMTLEQPFAYSMVGHLVNNAYSALGNPDTSDYLKEQLALPIFRKANGDVVLLNWNLPIVDLARIKNPLSKEGALDALAMVNPMMSVPVQLATNTNFATGRSIAHYPSDLGRRADFLLDQFGSVARAGTDTSYFQELANMDQNGLNRPDQLPLTLNSALPVQRPAAVYTANQYKYRDQLQDEIAQLQAQGEIVPTLGMLKKGFSQGDFIPDFWYPGKP
jgi:hypothetical protein